jgi:hypothetical protein
MEFFKTSDNKHYIIPLPDILFKTDTTTGNDNIDTIADVNYDMIAEYNNCDQITCRPTAFTDLFKKIKENNMGEFPYEDIEDDCSDSEDEEVIYDGIAVNRATVNRTAVNRTINLDVEDQKECSDFINICNYSFPEYKSMVERKINDYNECIRKKQRELKFYQEFRNLIKDLKEKRDKIDQEITTVKKEIETIM